MLTMPCECCGDSCTIASDDFAADDLATAWDVRTGSPTISGGVLNAGSGTNLLVHNTAAGAGVGAVGASVSFTGSSTTDSGRLIIAYVDDSNYWFCEGQPGVTNGTLKLFERASGTNTQRGSTATVNGWTTATGRTLKLCYSNGYVTANIGPIGSSASNTIVYAASVTVASTKAGIGASKTGTVTFDDFLLNRHASEDDSCPACDGEPIVTCCQEVWWPDSPSGSPSYPDMTATISGSCCTGFNNINHSFTTTRAIDGGLPEWSFSWTLNGTGFPPFNDCRSGSLSNSAFIRCRDNVWTITLINPSVGTPASVELTLLSCDPFHATAVVPDTFWGATLCNNSSFLDITE